MTTKICYSVSAKRLCFQPISRHIPETVRNRAWSHSHGSVSVVRTTFKVYGKMQTLTLSQPKTPEPIVTKF